MLATLHRYKPCSKCGSDQWLIDERYYKEPELPEIPIGSGRNKAIAKKKKIWARHMKRRKAYVEASVCQLCTMGGAEMFRV